MDIEDQVVSVELAKKLKEVRVEQDSVWKWFHNKYFGTTSLKKYDEIPLPLKKDEDVYSAFTVAELMEQLPAVIETKAGRYRLTIEKYEHLWCVSYIGTAGDALETILNKKLADALGEMLIWLVERGYVEVE